MDFAKYLSDDTKLLIAKQCNDRKKKQFIDLSTDSFYGNNTEYYHYKKDILKYSKSISLYSSITSSTSVLYKK